jgi:hypothetical protein
MTIRVSTSIILGATATILLCMLVAPQRSWAQVASGTITGTVRDNSGASIPNATVTVRENETSLVRSATSSHSGDYNITDLPIGTYTVETTATGFRKVTQTGIVLDVGRILQVNAVLPVGGVEQNIVVNAEPPQLETRQSALSGLVDEKRMVGLPLNGRNPLQLSLLLPGVQPAANTVFQTSNTLPQQQFISVSGGRGNTVVYLLDGGVNQDNYTNVANIYPNPDALQEFSIETNNFSAQYGTRLGGVVNAVTRSGTNQVHGALFEYLRNDYFNAHNYFSPGKSDGLKRNQYGVAVGGPIIKNKLFAFGSWQETHIRQTPVGLQAVLPTPAQLSGDFSGLKNAAGQQIVLKNPGTGVAYVNNYIDPSTFDPVAVKLLHYMPTPAAASGVVSVNQVNANNDDQFVTKVDYQATTNDRISIRWIHDTYRVISGLDPTDILGAQRLPDFHTHNATISWLHTLSPTLLMNSSFTFNRIQSGLSYGYPTTLADLGSKMTNLSPNPDIIVNVAGYFAIPTVAGGSLARNDFEYQESFTWQRGKHELRFGVDVLRQQLNQPGSAYFSDGQFLFQNSLSGSNLVDYLLGVPSTFTQATPQAEALRGLIPGTYVQDNYKITSKLTLNLGLRWEPFLPWIDVRNNEVANFIPGEQSTVAPGLPTGLVVYGDPGVPRAGYNGSLNKFDPRIGFAYQAAASTVIRGGAGIFRDYPNGIVNNRITLGPPFDVQVNIQNPTSLSNPFSASSPNPYPVTIPPPRGYVFPRPVLAVVYPRSFTNAHAFQENLTVEQQLTPNWLFRLSYIGAQGRNLLANNEINPARYIPGSSSLSNIDQRRPYYPIGFTSISEFESNSISNYNAMAATIEKRLSRGFSFLASYTFSKSMDMSSAVGTGGVFGIYTNPADPNYDYGLSDYNHTNRFVASGIYDTPELTAHKALNQLLGTWELNGIVTLQSGAPFTVLDGIDQSMDGVAADRPNIIGNPSLSWSSHTAEVAQYFNRTAFQLNNPGTFGSTGRNTLIGPGLFNVDYSMVKTFPIHEATKLQFRAEAFNLFNHPNFDNPNSTLNSPLFGKITTAEPSRVLQFALRFMF